jgi:aryl carrier-like protein
VSGQQPATATEQVVTRAWQEALGTEEFGTTDNFFDLGGHSVLMHVVHEQLVRELHRDVALVDLFRFPTVRAVAAHLDGAHRDGATGTGSTGRGAPAGGLDRLRARRTRRGAGVAR